MVLTGVIAYFAAGAAFDRCRISVKASRACARAITTI